jgi:hypothetical protein
MGKCPCVDSSNWLATCLRYYFPLCSARKSCVCDGRCTLVDVCQVVYSVCLSLTNYYIVLVSVYRFFIFSTLRSALPMFTKHVGANYHRDYTTDYLHEILSKIQFYCNKYFVIFK